MQVDAIRTLLPFLESPEDKHINLLEQNPIKEISGFYLFSVKGIVIPIDVENIYEYIESRFQSVLSAAHRANWTVLTSITGCSQGAKINIGFKNSTSSTNTDPMVFKQILNGLIPGLEINLDVNAKVSELINKEKFGGIVAGIPIVKISEERQRFNLPSIIRSLYGKNYSLFIISKPVSTKEIKNQLQHIWNIRDFCHKLARKSLGSERGKSESINEGFSITESTSFTNSNGKSLILLNSSESNQESESGTVSYSINLSKSLSENVTEEEQNSVAIELEQIAEQHSERLLKAVNIGEWESSITFVADSQSTREILTGTLLGELSKPSSDIFPIRVKYKDLSDKLQLLLPVQDNLSSVFPKSLASYINSEELAYLSSPPVDHLPSYDIRRTPTLNLSDSTSTQEISNQTLGMVCDHGFPLNNVKIHIDENVLAKHLFVCGLTGTGKTTTVKEILSKCDVPFLILESAKRDYRKLLGNTKFKGNLKIYTVGDNSIAPLRMNPFYILPYVSPLTHIDFLKSIFNASFSLYGPMPYILEKCLHNIYLKRGWDLTRGYHPRLVGSNGEPDIEKYQASESEHLFPTLPDLKDEVQDYVKTELDYKGEISDNIRTAIVTRLESLCVGSKGILFGSTKPFDISSLLKQPTVLELEALSDDDDKAFFVGLILTFISEFRQINNPSLNPFDDRVYGLQHLLVIEEAHRLLKNVSQERQSEQLGNPRGKAVEFFANVISEMRATGQGVVVVEQIPSKILPDVIKNTNAKIVHRLVASDDQTLVSSSLGIRPEEAIYLTSLNPGHMLYLKEGMQRPVEIAVLAEKTINSGRISHKKVKKAMKSDPIVSESNDSRSIEIRNILSATGETIAIKTLCSLIAGGTNLTKKIIDVAIRSIEHELKLKNHTYSKAEISNYLCNRLVGLLSIGIFQINEKSLLSIDDRIFDVVSEKSDSIENLLNKLSEGWDTDCAKSGLVYRLNQLVLNRVLSLKLKQKDITKIEAIVKSYFLIDIPETPQEIVNFTIETLRRK